VPGLSIGSAAEYHNEGQIEQFIEYNEQRPRDGRSVRYLIPDGVREAVLESRIYADRKAE
jgi:hypothetical protein